MTEAIIELREIGTGELIDQAVIDYDRTKNRVLAKIENFPEDNEDTILIHDEDPMGAVNMEDPIFETIDAGEVKEFRDWNDELFLRIIHRPATSFQLRNFPAPSCPKVESMLK